MTLNFSSTRSCSAPQSGRHRQNWNKSDRSILRRKGPAFYDPNPPAVFPPGTLVVSEGTEGQGAHKMLLQVGGSRAQLNTIHPPAVAARCHKKTEPCCGASTGEPLLDSNTAVSKQKACVAAQESVTCPKAGSSTGRMSQPCTELLQAQSFERQLCRES